MKSSDKPKDPSRRHVLSATAGAGALFAAGGFGIPRFALAQGAAAAEMIFRGGTIVTLEAAQPSVEAVAVGGGQILALGTEAEILALQTPETVVVDLKGAVLLPSFIDAHGHFMNAPQMVKWVNVQGVPAGPVTSIADIISAIKAHVEKWNVQPGEFIIGYGYDVTNLSDGRQLSRDDLDPVFPDNPVVLLHVSNHGCVLNSKGFEYFGIDETTETPEGGMILRQEGTNLPDGLLMEQAFAPIWPKIPQPSQEELLDNLDAAQRFYTSAGVTTAQEGGTHAGDLKFLMTAAEQGRFQIDVVSLPLVMEVPALVAEYFPSFTGSPGELPDTASASFGNYSNRLKLGGVKIPLDGSPQGKTAFWSQPLLTPGPAGEENWSGLPLFPPELVNKAVAEFAKKGVPIFVHANGDAAIDMLIDAVRASGLTNATDHRTTVIHSQCMRPEQLDAYAELGMSPSFFTLHTFFWGDVHLENLGQERAFFISPMASAKAKGLTMSNHTDFSVTPMEPMRVMHSAITRRARSGTVIGPDQVVDAMTALQAITIGAAWQIREETMKGTLAVGKLADLVILDANPLTVPTDDLLSIKVIETFKEGKSVYKAAA